MFINTSKIQFESKSQPTPHRLPPKPLMFINTSKIQFESKSQLSIRAAFFFLGCLSIRQRYNLKANHNSPGAFICIFRDVYQYVKDTI